MNREESPELLICSCEILSDGSVAPEVQQVQRGSSPLDKIRLQPVVGATILLLLTDPVNVTSAVDGDDISGLALELVGVIDNVLARLLKYL